ncbi:MAG TPA: UDP-glucose 4-epimerase GalE, partial [Alphaproteobacteria bacterium]|nr:UDP-glucose 4-epimerase GalE [Alphaproteobacteria bacterium]
WGPLEKADILDTLSLTEIFKKYKPLAVIHFAALIEVGESVKDPTSFWKNNVVGALSVLEAMKVAGVKNIVFSSTAAVYGQPDTEEPLGEDSSLDPINPYGQTKLAAERMIRDHESFGIKSVCLRYFNACGADPEGRVGEMHNPETHLIPLVVQTALGLRQQISIFGTDYPTADGTCVRDYVHVLDLADAHIKAVEHLTGGGETFVCNLGTGSGYSVREIINAVKEMSGNRDFEVLETDRRSGDQAFLVADNKHAQKILGWQPTSGLEENIRTALKFHSSDKYRNFWKNR